MERTKHHLKNEALTWPTRAGALAIRDQATYTAAAQLLLGIKALRAQIDANYDPVIAKAHETHKAALNAKREVEEPLVRAERVIKVKIGTWDAEQERVRQLAMIEARKVAEEEQVALRKQMVDTARHSGATRAEVSALRTMDMGEPVAVVPEAYQRQAGVSVRTVWYAEITDIRKLCRAVADGIAPIVCVEANMAALDRMASVTKGTISIPGVRVATRPVVSASSR